MHRQVTGLDPHHVEKIGHQAVPALHAVVSWAGTFTPFPSRYPTIDISPIVRRGNQETGHCSAEVGNQKRREDAY